MRVFRILLLLALWVAPIVASAQVTATLVSTQRSVQPGQTFTVALRLQHRAGWHTFWRNPGIGLPTRIEWNLTPGWQIGSIQWPVPTVLRTPQGEITGHGYVGVAYLPMQLTAPETLAPGQTVRLRANVRWLMCKTICVPGQQSVALTLPVRATPGAANDAVVAALAAQAMPAAATGWKLAASHGMDAITLGVAAPTSMRSLHFYPLDKFIDYRAPQMTASGERRAMLKLALDADEAMAPDARLRGVLAYTDADGQYRGVRVDVPFVSAAAVAAMGAPGTAGDGGVGLGGLSLGVLGLAFLGGLILNLMPCVFPVLGIKVLGFMEQAGRSRRKVAAHAWSFTGGVVLSFWALAGVLALLRSGGEQLGWGFQLQSPAFVFALAVVMLVFALNLSGVFEFGLRATSIGSRWHARRGLAGSFCTGVLATIVATPCSAPFLAPALGAALALPSGQSFVVFTVIAFGLCVPYLLLATSPRLIGLLPRPGRWMETFKQLMAFPLYATVGYLVWVLAGQTAAHGLLNVLFALALLALAAWLYGRFMPARGSTPGRVVVMAGAAVVFVVGLGLGWPRPAQPDALQWQAWSPERVSQLQHEGRPIYVDFTARWCATCQVNKKVVFGSESVRDYFRAHDVAALKADWTNADPRITRALARYGRSAVPFNLVYPAHSQGQTPRQLPEVLTPAIVLAAFGDGEAPLGAH